MSAPFPGPSHMSSCGCHRVALDKYATGKVVATVRVTTMIASLGLVALLMGACASATTSTGSSVLAAPSLSDPASSLVAASAPAPASASASVGIAVDCQGIGTTTSAITSAVRDVGALVGTAADPTAILAELPALQVTVASLVPACVPDAEATMWSLVEALDRLGQGFEPGRDKTAMAADRALLLNTRIAGNALFGELGMDPAAWQDIPRKARLICADLAKTGPPLTTAVTELSRIVGSSNDRSPYYLTRVAGLAAAITDLAPACDPKSQAASAALASAVEKLTTDFKPGTDPSVLATDKAALNQVRAAGTTLYRLLGLNTVGWENVPAEAR